MKPRWEQIDAPPPPAGRLFMDATLAPNRSLSVRAFTWLIAVFVTINSAMAIFFAMKGAYPVLAFLVLDVALVIGAFWINYRDGRARERVVVAADRLHVMRQPVRGGAEHYVTHPHWAQVHTEERAVRIAAGGRDLTVAAALSADERADFAEALRRALLQARAP
jgi:uncharacterized membrane protein